MTTTFAHPSDVVAAIRPLRFTTLLDVERRKLTDTRSGRGLLAATVAAAAAVLVWKVTHAEIETSFDNYSAGVATMVAFLTPLIALLAMTSEWTQRTALTTFTLAPRRFPVLAAKYVAAVLLSLGATVTGLVMAAAATAIGGGLHGPASFDGWAGDVRYALIFVAPAGDDGRGVRRPRRQHPGGPQRLPARPDAVGDARRRASSARPPAGSTSSRPTAGCRRRPRRRTSPRR